MWQVLRNNSLDSNYLFFLLFTLLLDGEAGWDRWGQGRRGHRHLEFLCSCFVSLLRQVLNLRREKKRGEENKGEERKGVIAT